MANIKRKVVLVGAGMVGMSFAYAALNQSICDELVLIDLNRERAIGEAMDLNHGLAFSNSSMKIYAGDYSDCSDADIVVICAGVNQKPGETRLQLLQRNAKVFEAIVPRVVSFGFDGIFLVATNPVDIMTRVTYELSGFNAAKVIGTGTTLDSARLRYLLGDYFEVDPRNIHAYVIGEHGDSEFVPWSQAILGVKPVYDMLRDNSAQYKMDDLKKMSNDVRTAAYEIIKAKGATYYGIGSCMAMITNCILNDERRILPVSNYDPYSNTYNGFPAVVGAAGIIRRIGLDIDEAEQSKLNHSINVLKEAIAETGE